MQRPEFVSGKVVLIISPQPWGPIRISKHHYAKECCLHARRVYFLNPPTGDLPESVMISKVPEAENLRIVDYRPRFPFRIRFHARPLFDWLMRWQIRSLKAAIKERIDVVWCFDFNLFTDLRIWTDGTRIFQPVDPVSLDSQIAPGRSADAVLSVSEQILANYRKVATRAVVINHGVAPCFLEGGLTRVAETGERISFGYVGNLTRGPLDRKLCRALVEGFAGVRFVFWGPYEDGGGNLGGNTDTATVSFVDWLKSAPNVELRGGVSPERLAEEIGAMDGFLLMYRSNAEYDCSNSHKILEYLSTGRVVVSTRIASYPENSELIVMAEGQAEFLELFAQVLARLDSYNDASKAANRRELAKSNSYQAHLMTIDGLLKDEPVAAVTGQEEIQ
jgi:glycosyltransferase involved in cell wall biosynthesis